MAYIACVLRYQVPTSLFRLSLALFSEQVSELDEGDLYPGVAQRIALHLAAAFPAYGEFSRVILTSLLSMFPAAAQVPDSKDWSLLLHRVVENEHKSRWTLEGAKDVYEAYPPVAQCADQRPRTRRGRRRVGVGDLQCCE